MKILIVSLIYHPGFELADSYLARVRKKFDITYAIKSNKMYNLKNKKVSNTYCGFPGFKEMNLKKVQVRNKLFFYSWFVKRLIKNDV